MNKKKILLFNAIFWLLFATGCGFGPDNGKTVDNGGSETWGMRGKLVDTASNVVEGAIVNLYPADTSFNAPALLCDTTDTGGIYCFDSTRLVKSNQYRITAVYDNNSLAALIDGIKYAGPLMEIGTYIMKAPGAIAGTVHTYEPSYAGILCYVPGTSFSAFTDDTGAFIMSGLPAGFYNVYFSTDGYLRGTDSLISVISGQTTRLPLKQLEIDPSGAPPSPENLAAEYDTASGAVLLYWKHVTVSDLEGYELFIDSGSSGPVPLSNSFIADTFYADTVRFFSNDSIPAVFSYQVRSVDSSGNPGQYSNPVSITVYPRPLPGTWISKTSIPVERRFSTAAAIDTIIIVAGGESNVMGGTKIRQVPSAQTFTYNITNNSWSETGAMICEHSAAATAVVNGKMYVFGGNTYNESNRSRELTSIVECYNPETGKWDSVSSMPQACEGSAAATSGNIIYVFGGESSSGFIDSIYRFDPSGNTSAASGRLIHARSFHQAVSLDGLIYIMGGWDKNGIILESSEVFIPSSGKVTAGQPMNTARCNFGAAAANNRIYVFGGFGKGGLDDVLDGIEFFDVSSGLWSAKGSMSRAAHALSAVECSGKIFIAGGSTEGYPGFNESATMEVYYP